MSAAQPAITVFDTSVRESHEWFADVMRETGLDEQRALSALRAVLHALRDEMTVRQSGRFASEMPALVRGLFFEGWDPSRPAADHDLAGFLARVRAQLPADDGFDYLGLTRAIIRVLERRMPVPSTQIKRALPKELRALWPTSEAEETAERHARLVAEEGIATYEALHEERGTERGAPLAPHQNRPPSLQHRGGPLPNIKK